MSPVVLKSIKTALLGECYCFSSVEEEMEFGEFSRPPCKPRGKSPCMQIPELLVIKLSFYTPCRASVLSIQSQGDFLELACHPGLDCPLFGSSYSLSYPSYTSAART